MEIISPIEVDPKQNLLLKEKRIDVLSSLPILRTPCKFVRNKLPYYKNQTRPKKGTPYKDTEFLNNPNSLGINVEWKKASEVFKGKPFYLFEEKIEPGDLRQGSIGDCYFIATIASIAEYPYMIYNLFITKEINEEGYFEIALFLDGRWQIVIVDDYLPVLKGSNYIAYAKSVNNEIWVVLLEKAWAKIKGGYPKTKGGQLTTCFEIFTGFPSVQYKINKNPEEVWKRIYDGNSKDQLFTCSFREYKGLRKNHAYSLLEAVEIDSDGKKVKLLKIRNPYGVGEWQGDWSDTSKLWEEEEIKQVDFEKKSDGIFYMELNDFVAQSGDYAICYVEHNVNTKQFLIRGKDLENGNVFNLYLPEDGNFEVSRLNKESRKTKISDLVHIPNYLSIIKYDPDKIPKPLSKQNTMDIFFNDYNSVPSWTHNASIEQDLKAGYYLVYLYQEIPEELKDSRVYYYIAFSSKIKFVVEKMDNDYRKDNFPLLRRIKQQAVFSLQPKFISKRDTSECKKLLNNDDLGYFLAYNQTDQYIKYTISTSKLNSMKIISPYELDNEKNEINLIIPPKDWGIILSIRTKALFDFKIDVSKPEQLSNKPDNFDENDLFYTMDISKYANKEVVTKTITNPNEYYDHISLSEKKLSEDIEFIKKSIIK